MTDTQQLTAVSSSGNQETTQNPQSASASSSSGAQTNDFQPTTTSSSLTSNVGVPLQPTAVTTVPLVAATTTIAAANPVTVVSPTHHMNAGLLALPALFLVVGISVFLAISRSAKNTTS